MTRMVKNRKGFTLAELIMAIALLAFFSVFIVRMFAKADELTKKAHVLDQAVLCASDLADQWKRSLTEDTLPIVADLQQNLTDGRTGTMGLDGDFRATEPQQAEYLVFFTLQKQDVGGLWTMGITICDKTDGLNTPVYDLQVSRYFIPEGKP